MLPLREARFKFQRPKQTNSVSDFMRQLSTVVLELAGSVYAVSDAELLFAIYYGVQEDVRQTNLVHHLIGIRRVSALQALLLTACNLSKTAKQLKLISNATCSKPAIGTSLLKRVLTSSHL